MDNKFYFENDARKFFKPYENFFYGLSNIRLPFSGKKREKAIVSVTRDNQSAIDSKKILEDYHRIGKDLKVAIDKYENSRK